MKKQPYCYYVPWKDVANSIICGRMTNDLMDDYSALWEAIHKSDCYGKHDYWYLQIVGGELQERGWEIFIKESGPVYTQLKREEVEDED